MRGFGLFRVGELDAAVRQTVESNRLSLVERNPRSCSPDKESRGPRRLIYQSESERLRSSVRRLAIELGGTRGLGVGDCCCFDGRKLARL